MSGWRESTRIGTRGDNSKDPMVLFCNSYTGAGPAAGVWTAVDLTAFGVPRDAHAVFLSGILIITHGTTQETADLTVSLRAPGSALPISAYLGQSVEAHVGGGQRSTMSAWVPCVDGSIEWAWQRSTQGQWPTNCAYGVNMSLQAYVR